jgi:hypothetical protein
LWPKSGATPKEKQKKRKISNLLNTGGGFGPVLPAQLLNQFFVFSVLPSQDERGMPEIIRIFSLLC